MNVMYVGLGTTGLRVLENIEKTRQFLGLPENRLNDRVRYLYLETAAGGPPSGGAWRSISLPLTNVVESVRSHRNNRSLDCDWIPWGEGDQGTPGAGQRPTLGRLALWCKDKKDNRTPAEILRGHLAEVQSEFGTERFQVVVVSGTYGGTGVGIFLDVAYIIRKFMNALGLNSPGVNAVLIIPHSNSNHPACRNAYAALKNLHYFNSVEFNASWPVSEANAAGLHGHPGFGPFTHTTLTSCYRNEASPVGPEEQQHLVALIAFCGVQKFFERRAQQIANVEILPLFSNRFSYANVSVALYPRGLVLEAAADCLVKQMCEMLGDDKKCTYVYNNKLVSVEFAARYAERREDMERRFSKLISELAAELWPSLLNETFQRLGRNIQLNEDDDSVKRMQLALGPDSGARQSLEQDLGGIFDVMAAQVSKARGKFVGGLIGMLGETLDTHCSVGYAKFELDKILTLLKNQKNYVQSILWGQPGTTRGGNSTIDRNCVDGLRSSFREIDLLPKCKEETHGHRMNNIKRRMILFFMEEIMSEVIDGKKSTQGDEILKGFLTGGVVDELKKLVELEQRFKDLANSLDKQSKSPPKDGSQIFNFYPSGTFETEVEKTRDSMMQGERMQGGNRFGFRFGSRLSDMLKVLNKTSQGFEDMTKEMRSQVKGRAGSYVGEISPATSFPLGFFEKLAELACGPSLVVDDNEYSPGVSYRNIVVTSNPTLRNKVFDSLQNQAGTYLLDNTSLGVYGEGVPQLENLVAFVSDKGFVSREMETGTFKSYSPLKYLRERKFWEKLYWDSDLDDMDPYGIENSMRRLENRLRKAMAQELKDNTAHHQKTPFAWKDENIVATVAANEGVVKEALYSPQIFTLIDGFDDTYSGTLRSKLKEEDQARYDETIAKMLVPFRPLAVG